MQPKVEIVWAQQVSGQETFGQVNSNKRITRHGELDVSEKLCRQEKRIQLVYVIWWTSRLVYQELRIFVQTIVSTSKEAFEG